MWPSVPDRTPDSPSAATAQRTTHTQRWVSSSVTLCTGPNVTYYIAYPLLLQLVHMFLVYINLILLFICLKHRMLYVLLPVGRNAEANGREESGLQAAGKGNQRTRGSDDVSGLLDGR